MQSMAPGRFRASRTPYAFFVLFLTAATLLHADVTGVTGTITSNESESRYGASQSISMQLQGSNFSLNAFISSDNLVNFSGSSQTVTFYPAATGSAYMPQVIGANPGYNDGTLVYNGISYSNLKINFAIAGASTSVVNSGVSDPRYFFSGGVSSVPFSMTGVVSVYSDPPVPQGTNPNPILLFSVNFSGAGLYNASVIGSLPASGSPGSTGSSTYQFLSNPLGFTTDTTTQGTWTGKYGGEGYLIANGPSSLPGYAAVSLSQASTYTWAPQTLDIRALQNGLGAPSRIASSYYGNSFNINLNFTDASPHRVALYLLDFDTTSRSETLTVMDANTGATLDTETISGFQNGVYAIWNLKGNVTINVKRASGASAVVSGIFFGPPSTIQTPPANPTASAAYQGTNTAIKGAWEGHYGSGGYMIANGPTNLTTTSVIGAFPYTWAANTTDPRALETNTQGSAAIASAFTQYQSTSFKINVNNSPGNTELLTLYLLDWDYAGRVETITITDLATGAVLDTETFLGFQGGIYASWLITGNVVVQVTPSGSSSPVISGIFVN